MLVVVDRVQFVKMSYNIPALICLLSAACLVQSQPTSDEFCVNCDDSQNTHNIWNFVDHQNNEVHNQLADVIKRLEKLEQKVSADCSELWQNGVRRDGAYNIEIPLKGIKRIIQVYCEFNKDGGWTRIQHRQDGSVDFYRNWEEYKNGFGSVSGEQYLGNDIISQMTNLKSYILRVNLEHWNGTTYHADYSSFKIDDESKNYRLHVSGYSGNSGDSFGRSDNYQFSTPDRDNDQSSGQCSVDHHGAFWYWFCTDSNLNGQYWHDGKCSYSYTRKCITWVYLENSINTPFKKVTMMIRDAAL